MSLKHTKMVWNDFAKTDPLWAILSLPGKRGGQWDINEFFAVGRKEIDEMMAFTTASGIDFRRKKALDFGCGVGRITQALARCFDECHGLDISPRMIEMANTYNRYKERVTYHLNQDNDLHLFPDASFDFIYTIITLQHMEPRFSLNYIKEFLRVLRPSGILIFQLPSERVKQLTYEDESIAKRIRRLTKTACPKPLLFFYRKMRYGQQTEAEMFGIKREEVIDFVELNKGRIVDVQQDTAAGERWISYKYFVTKE